MLFLVVMCGCVVYASSCVCELLFEKVTRDSVSHLGILKLMLALVLILVIRVNFITDISPLERLVAVIATGVSAVGMFGLMLERLDTMKERKVKR